jgi:cytochrome c556
MLIQTLGILFSFLLGFSVAESKPLAQVSPQVKALMLKTVIPTSTVIFNVAGEAPKNTQEWQAVVKNAQELQKATLLLASKPLTISQPEWQSAVSLFRTSAEQVLKAAKAQDAEKVADIGNNIYEACDLCHQYYMERK